MRADRLLQLLYLLRRHRRLPARRLAELLEVSERTVLRDMEALSAAGVPVYTERGRGGGCVLLEGYSTDVSGLSVEEAQALFAWSARSAVTDLGLGPQLGSALAKLAATVPQPALERADALAAVVVVDRRRWFAAVEEVPVLPVLRDAAVDRRRLRLTYRGAEQESASERTVDPYGVVENAGRWYLVAAHRGQTRSYRVSRIEAATVLDTPADVPPDLDLTAEWDRLRTAFESSAPGISVTVAVDPGIADTFRMVATGQSQPGRPPTTAAPDPTAAPPADAWPVVTAHLRARQSALSLVLGFGGQVLLLAPVDLRHDVVERARATLVRHTMEP